MERIRVSIVYLVDDINQSGRMEERIHEEGISEVNRYVISFSGICAYGRYIVLRHRTEFSGIRVKTEYAPVLAFVDALFPVKDTAKVKVFDRRLAAIAF